jgi:hypothetical protein
MNADETLRIIAALKACGATHFKSQDFEVSICASVPTAESATPPQVVGNAPIQPPPPVENTEATEKLKELIKTMSLPPEQLVDVIFPAGAGG